jgi:hypothetical protein
MKKLLLVVMTISFVVLTSRCTFTEDIEKLSNLATDSLSLVLGTPVFDTGLQLAIKNAKTNDYIEDAEVTVTVTGKDAAIVYNNLGIKSSAYKTKLGLIHLILDPTKIDSAAMLTTPKEFDVQISAPGYTSVTNRVQFDQKNTRFLTVSLVKLNDAPAGVEVASVSSFASSSASGSTTSAAILPLNGGEQQLSLAPGVVLRDATGAAVTGIVAANVVYYDPTANNAESVFPGGLIATVDLGGGNKDVFSLEPIGMFNIKLTAGGKSVKTFSNGGLTLKTEIPVGAINPSTNQPYKVNDKVDMWSREEGSGEWKFEKEATVKNVNGKLILEESVTHLSDHMFVRPFRGCEISIYANFSGKVSGYGNYTSTMEKVLFYIVDEKGNERQVNSNRLDMGRDGTVLGRSVSARVYIRSQSEKIKIVPSPDNVKKMAFSQTLFDVPADCKNLITNNITVTEAAVPDPNLNINFNLQVSSGPLTVKPSMEIKYRKTGSSETYSSAFLTLGTGKMSIALSTDYDVAITLGANQGKAKMKIEANGTDRYKVTFSGLSLGDQSSSAPIVIQALKAADGSINVEYKVEVDADVIGQLT